MPFRMTHPCLIELYAMTDPHCEVDRSKANYNASYETILDQLDHGLGLHQGELEIAYQRQAQAVEE